MGLSTDALTLEGGAGRWARTMALSVNSSDDLLNLEGSWEPDRARYLVPARGDVGTQFGRGVQRSASWD